ncbi:YjiH family protein [Corynebacterium atrinae]|uniref:YjiH family protein n=1 Tax=Corynebacterium atrinae TaxID=1336740 RepID=UPI0025B2F8DD|nr:YjiH family protein [Corynebacterium atrinae]
METQSRRTSGSWRFFVYSAIGIFAFFVPVTIAGTSTILLDHIVTGIRTVLGDSTKYLIYLMIVAGAIYPFATGRWRQSAAKTTFALLGILGLVVATMLVFNFGPAVVFRPDIGPFLFDKLVVPIGLLVPVGGIFLAFLVGFGLMEFVGVLAQPLMRPVFKLPGRAAIDAVASFVGSYSLGLLVTNRVYKRGGYTAKEAAIIATGFSTVSATFMIVIAKTLDIMHVWGPYFLGTLVVTFATTAITVYLPPLRTFSTDCYPGVTPTPEQCVSGSRIRAAWDAARQTLVASPSVGKVLWYNFRDGVVMAMQILPGILSVGFLGLLAATFTPAFKVLGYIFYPLVHLLPIPDPGLAAESLAIGLAELFLPATLVAGNDSELLRMIIAMVSVSQVLFFSAMIPAVLATEIPLKIWQMVLTWFFRVVISVIITVPVAMLIVM